MSFIWDMLSQNHKVGDNKDEREKGEEEVKWECKKEEREKEGDEEMGGEGSRHSCRVLPRFQFGGVLCWGRYGGSLGGWLTLEYGERCGDGVGGVGEEAGVVTRVLLENTGKSQQKIP